MRLVWPGFNEMGTVIIPLNPDTFCVAKYDVTVLDKIFKPKQEIHVTLIGKQLGALILAKMIVDHTIEEKLKTIFDGIDWSYRPINPGHLLERTKGEVAQKSIILLLEMPGVDEYYDRLKSQGLIESEVLTPPPHVTLYTHNCLRGIGVKNNDDLNRLAVKMLSINVLNKLCHHTQP